MKENGTFLGMYSGGEAIAMARLHILREVERRQIMHDASMRVVCLDLLADLKDGAVTPQIKEAFHIANARRGLGKAANLRSIYRWKAAFETAGGNLAALYPEDGRRYVVEGNTVRPASAAMLLGEMQLRQRNRRRLQIKRDIVYWITNRATETDSSFKAVARQVSNGEFTLILHPEEDRHPTDAYLSLLQRFHLKGGRVGAFISLRTLESWREEVNRADAADARSKELAKIRATRSRKNKSKNKAKVVAVDGQAVPPNTSGILLENRRGYTLNGKQYYRDND